MSYTRPTLSPKVRDTIIFSIILVALVILIGLLLYAELRSKGFAVKLNLVIKPIANMAIAIGIFTFVVSAYQQSVRFNRENTRALDNLNRFGWLEVEKIFLEHPELAPLYYELYIVDNENKIMSKGISFPKQNTSDISKERMQQQEYHILSYLIQVMENVYSVGNLEHTYYNPEMEGWMNTFRSWSRSPKFKEVWVHNKNLYGRSFREWVDIVIYRI